MKIIHTSDWHLGRLLYRRKRYEEFAAFLDWLANTIESLKIDALLIAGDIFDTSTPSNQAQKLYYQFLYKVANSCCRHIVIIAGNHDSPSFLNAPKELLSVLNVYVVGAVTDYLEDEVIVLNIGQNEPEAIVCAIPYLRDKDIRIVEPGETIEDKNTKLIKGLRNHYANVCGIAEAKRKEFQNGKNTIGIPIITMGHLFTVGGKTVDGDGVRELYVGSLAHVGKDIFPISTNYFALGHLHVSQCVGGAVHIRYSGSPIPMGFGEANQQKKVVVVEFNSKTPTIQELLVPCFQPLERMTGSLEDIQNRIDKLKYDRSNAWLEIEYTGSEIIDNLWDLLGESLNGTSMEILCIKNKRIIDRVIRSMHEGETLDDLDVYDVFERCLDTNEIPIEDRSEITQSYNEIIKSLYEEDVNAE